MPTKSKRVTGRNNKPVPLGVAQIGYGVLGKSLFKAVDTHPNFQNIVVCEPNCSQTEALVQEANGWRISLNTQYSEAINHANVDVVFVNTPAETHYEICAAAITAGKHVFCAKPLTPNLSDSKRLVGLAQARGVSLTVGHQMKYSAHFQYVKEILDSKILGEISNLTFINNKRRLSPGNLKHQKNPILWEMTTHHLDTLFYLFPMEQWRLRGATLSRPARSAYDSNTHVDALFMSNSGITLLYQSGFDSLRSNYFFRMEGSTGVLDILGDHISMPVQHYLHTDRENTSRLLQHNRQPSSSWTSALNQLTVDIDGKNTTEISGIKNIDVLSIIDQIERHESKRN
jgi:predicted dehydrogenase